ILKGMPRYTLTLATALGSLLLLLLIRPRTGLGHDSRPQILAAPGAGHRIMILVAAAVVPTKDAYEENHEAGYYYDVQGQVHSEFVVYYPGQDMYPVGAAAAVIPTPLPMPVYMATGQEDLVGQRRY
ncbi:hypothetical protein DFQ26_001224, partial [Actinomortierella ambigua]